MCRCYASLHHENGRKLDGKLKSSLKHTFLLYSNQLSYENLEDCPAIKSDGGDIVLKEHSKDFVFDGHPNSLI